MFNPELLSQLIKKAMGNRTLTAFANDAGVSTGNLSKIVNGPQRQSPYPDTIVKISKVADNNVTLYDLMAAAGYENAEYTSVLDITNEFKKLKETLLTYPDNVLLDNNHLSKLQVKFLVQLLDSNIEYSKLITKIK